MCAINVCTVCVYICVCVQLQPLESSPCVSGVKSEPVSPMRDIHGKKSMAADATTADNHQHQQHQQQQQQQPGVGFRSLQHLPPHYASSGSGLDQVQGGHCGNGSRENVASPFGSGGIGGGGERQAGGLIAPSLLAAAYGTSGSSPLCSGNNVATAKRSRMASELWVPC